MSSQASLLGLPYELREQIFEYAFLRPEGPFVAKGHRFFLQHHSDKGRRLVGERPKAYLLPNEGAGYRLFSKHVLGQVNRQLRCEISNFLRTAPVDVVTVVKNFNYGHMIAFLESLPQARLKDFLVQPDVDADYTRSLRIELSSRYDEDWQLRLIKWLSLVTAVMPSGEELSTATSLAPQPKKQRAPLKLLLELYHLWNGQSEGPAREELRKIMVLFWARLRLEGLAITGVYSRDQLDRLGMIPFEAEYDQFLRWFWLGF